MLVDAKIWLHLAS